jgi:hypothetical protein
MQNAGGQCERAPVGLVQAACLDGLRGVKSFDAKDAEDAKEEKENEQ